MNQQTRKTLLQSFGTPDGGLTKTDILKHRELYGLNELPLHQTSFLEIFFRQWNDVLVWILLGAMILSVLATVIEGHGTLSIHDLTDSLVILGILLVNALLGTAQEWRAEHAMSALAKLSDSTARVRRDGILTTIPSRELVPGDLVVIEAGDRLSADARVISSSSLEVDESSLTGESLPVAKSALDELGSSDKSAQQLFSGTLVMRGVAEAIVEKIGLTTELGKISQMVQKLSPPPTPLQTQLQKTGKRIGIIVFVLCCITFAIGIARGIAASEMFFVAISLAVAAVPEGLPAIVTVCLALGVQKMSKIHALVRRLDSIETLGSVSVICADKTGTITQNKMSVCNVWSIEEGNERLVAIIAASCNRAELPDIGDPTEVGLLSYAAGLGVVRMKIEYEEIPFSSELQYMVTRHTEGASKRRFMKGSPEAICSLATTKSPAAEQLLAKANEWSKEGLRVLAVAEGKEETVHLVGLIALQDPPREGVHEAVMKAKGAGIRTIMITGDHPATALAIARKVGIATGPSVITGAELHTMSDLQLEHELQTVSVFARVRPEDKVRILEAVQKTGAIVAMTGDGVNDAPALKKAHVGISMGNKGTDVAREASSIVLTDDNYSTIVAAIEEGRRIYENIRKFVVFLLRSNTGEIMIISGAIAFGFGLPLLPIHILWINLITDSLPALALAAEPAEPGVMRRPPRPLQEGIFANQFALTVLAGLCNAMLALWVYFIALSQTNNLHIAQTATLMTTTFYQLCIAVSSRTTRSSGFFSIHKNVWLIISIAAAASLQILLLYTPLSSMFSVTPLTLQLWKLVIGGSLGMSCIFEVSKYFYTTYCLKVLRQ